MSATYKHTHAQTERETNPELRADTGTGTGTRTSGIEEERDGKEDEAEAPVEVPGDKAQSPLQRSYRQWLLEQTLAFTLAPILALPARPRRRACVGWA